MIEKRMMNNKSQMLGIFAPHISLIFSDLYLALLLINIKDHSFDNMPGPDQKLN